MEGGREAGGAGGEQLAEGGGTEGLAARQAEVG
eukprot:COSAG02_NODE_572_length_20163_cov_9.875461_1_plen_32_part_10